MQIERYFLFKTNFQENWIAENIPVVAGCLVPLSFRLIRGITHPINKYIISKYLAHTQADFLYRMVQRSCLTVKGNSRSIEQN